MSSSTSPTTCSLSYQVPTPLARHRRHPQYPYVDHAASVFPGDTGFWKRTTSIQLMDTEVALYWKVMRRHLQTEAQNNCHKIKLTPYSMSCTVPWSVSEKVGLDGGINLDANPVVPSTPAPRSVRPAMARRRARRAPSSSDDNEAEAEGETLDITSVIRVQATPSMAVVRAQRASKTTTLGKYLLLWLLLIANKTSCPT